MKHSILYLIIGIITLTGCKKLIEVSTPPNQLTTDKVFSDTTSANSAMVSAYAIFNVGIDPNYNKFLSIYTDEFAYTSTASSNVEYFQSKVSTGNTSNLNTWSNLYFAIYQCNDIITQLKNSTALPATKVNSLMSESKFLRAYAYFYLLNIYGHVPLTITTDVNANAKALQSDSVAVFNQIVEDLKDAQNGLSASYLGAGKVRANKWAATALLAKVYLYQRDYINAESQATSLINSGLFTPLDAIGNVFLSNSKETILAFSTVNGFITDAPNLIPTSGIPGYAATTSLLSAFEVGDLRKSNWLKSTIVSGTTYYYPFKYHNRTTNTAAPENLIALRASELYLIRAEARINQGEIPDGITDLNILRSRARDAASVSNPNPLPSLNLNLSKIDALTAVQHERQVELFAENGNRFLDLKRTGRLNSIMSALKTTWKPTAIFLPIPQNEITFNSNLIQNPGY